jgi:hypothetical protein
MERTGRTASKMTATDKNVSLAANNGDCTMQRFLLLFLLAGTTLPAPAASRIYFCAGGPVSFWYAAESVPLVVAMGSSVG